MQLLTAYKDQLQAELTGNILPFHMGLGVDRELGGFYGYIDNELNIDRAAPKGLVQHSRLLWTFAHAYRRLPDPAYLAAAARAYGYLRRHFWDAEQQGLFWLVDAQGQPLDKHKIIYGQAFALYGLSEYFLASDEKQSLDWAVTLFHLLEENAADPEFGGYFEAFEQDWRFTAAINVDETAVPTVKSMNTHLHLLEAYTNLLRAWDSPKLRRSLGALLQVMREKIIEPNTGQMKLHFTADWRSLTPHVSYGHDIEASWLLVEAAEVLGNEARLDEVRQLSQHMAQTAYDEGLEWDGSLREQEGRSDRVWWVQAEAMVGFFNAYQLCAEPHFLQASLACWQAVQETLIDRQYGEWIYGRDGDGRPLAREKSGLWKAPYHNGRACLEIMRRIEQLMEDNHVRD